MHEQVVVGNVVAGNYTDRSKDSTIASRLTKFIQAEIALGDGEILEDTDLLLSGAVDSLGVIRITHWIEDETGKAVDPGDVTLENFQTIGHMTAYIAARSAPL